MSGDAYANKIFNTQLTNIQNIECIFDETNEMQFVIYYFDQNTNQNEIKNFNSNYFFCNKQWLRKVKDALNRSKQWNVFTE